MNAKNTVYQFVTAIKTSRQKTRIGVEVGDVQEKLTVLNDTGNGQTKRAVKHREKIFELLDETDRLDRRKI